MRVCTTCALHGVAGVHGVTRHEYFTVFSFSRYRPTVMDYSEHRDCHGAPSTVIHGWFIRGLARQTRPGARPRLRPGDGDTGGFRGGDPGSPARPAGDPHATPGPRLAA